MENVGIDLKKLKVFEFEAIKERIYVKLVSQDLYQERYTDGPFVQVVDLVGVYGILLNNDEHSCMTMHVSQGIFERWGIDEETLYTWAVVNTKKLFGYIVRPMTEVLTEKTEMIDDEIVKDFFDELDSKMFVVTNNTGMNGASTILIPEVLGELAEKVQEDLIVIPSSIHEVIAFPACENYRIDELNALIVDVNETQLKKEEVLSNHAYRYEKGTERFSIAN